MPPTLRYLREYLRPDPARTSATETVYTRDGENLAATVYRPQRRAGRLPGWVVLHGLTTSGRAHSSLVRFARSVAAAGNLVFVPDIPEWRALRLDPAITNATIRAAVHALQQRDDVDHRRAGLFGFSFGATQAIIAAADPEVQTLLHAVAAWGGYADVERLFVHGMTGEHELDGVEYQAEPDPYGTWIIAGQYLSSAPGHEDDGDVAAALHGLALEAGRRRVYAGDPSFDGAKAAARAKLPREKQALFDVIAPPTSRRDRDTALTRRLSRELAATALRCDPLIDPRPLLDDVRTPVLLAHGRDDRLIPFTETIRLSRALAPETVRGCTITSLFAHSGGTRPGLGAIGLAREAARFYGLLRGVLELL
ncbi:MAG: alpha/beta hydrolase family protein [Longimicrobiales bacterium]